MQMIEIEPLIDIIKLTLQSAYVKDVVKPMNLLLIAKPESAKTSAMACFKIKGTLTTNNITQAVIVSKILPMIEREGLKHLIIPDFLNAIEKDYTTRKGFLNMVKTLIEEGITSLDTFNMRTNRVYDPPIKCGLITGITTESFHGEEYDPSQQRYRGGVRYEWKRTGLLSRFIPFSYKYELSKINRVFDYIANADRELQLKGKESIQRRMISVKGNEQLFNRTRSLSQDIGKATGGYGFRMQLSLQTLMKANAVLNMREEVVREDAEKIEKLGNWMNFENNCL
jgi:hypothetical protein